MATTEAEVVQSEPELEPQKKTRSRAMVRHEEPLPAAPANDSQMLQGLMTEAIRSGNRELMREVMEIRRELKAEAAKEAFFAALSAFQAECPIIKRTKPVYDIDKQTRQRKGVRYHYAPMDEIVRIVSPILTKHGLSYTIVAPVETAGNEPWLIAKCTVHHELGHNETSEFRIPL